jgi:hypothetical protein
MNIVPSDVILLAHATFGVLGTLSALWFFVEVLNASEGNAIRTRTAATLVATFMVITGIVGGYWYLRFYPSDRTVILQGPWPFAHNVFMETKEHLFFMTLILALYLPIIASERLHFNPAARRLALWVAFLIVLTGLAMEGSGAIINQGAKLALRQAATQRS